MESKTHIVTDEKDKVKFTDISNDKVKVHFSFSKDPNKNKIALDGLKQFWAEVYN